MIVNGLRKRIVSELIKNESKVSKISLSKLAEEYGTTRQNFSRIVTCHAEINPKTINYILNRTSGMSFDFDDTMFDKGKEYYFKCLKAFYYLDTEEADTLFTELSRQLYFSYGLPYYLLSKAYLYLTKKDITSFIEYINLIMKMKECIPFDERASLNYLIAFKYYKEDKVSQAYQLLIADQDMLRHADPYIEILSKQLLSYNCCELNKPLEGMSYTMEAIRDYQKNNNSYRAITLSVNIGNNYLLCNDYYSAISSWKETKDNARRSNIISIMNLCDANIAYAYFELSEYERVLEIEPEMTDGLYHNHHIIALFWAAYFTHKEELCKEYALMMGRCSGDAHYNRLISSLMNIYVEKKELSCKEKLLEEIYKYSNENGKVLESIWCLRILMYEYKRENRSDKLIETMEKVLNVMNYHTVTTYM